MTETKLEQALELRDSIITLTKKLKDLEALFDEWARLHRSESNGYDYAFVDKKKEWDIITRMAEYSDSIWDAVLLETLHQGRIAQRQLSESIEQLNKKLSKL